MGLVLFLAGQLVGGLAEPFNGFQFLPHGFHVDGVHLLLGGQQVDLALPCLGGDFLTAVLQFLQIPGRRIIEDQFRLWRCSNSSRFSGFTLASCLRMGLYLLYCAHISPRSVRVAIRRSAWTIFPRRS